ncbi:DUF106 domain-containing protein [Nanohaloarchaea archaeon H01]|nr:DUF106 domain-containing protein [Nanohaloarchaea archaeon H01]
MVSIESFLTGLYGFYNAIFEPVLAAGPYVALAFFSASLAAVFSIIYWLLLDIEKNKKLKEKISDTQDLMKEARKNDNSEKASEHMQKTMELNQKMMMLNFKPMIATMVFVALIFPWLGATFSPAVDMNQVGNSTYEGKFTYAGQTTSIQVTESNETDTLEIGDQKVTEGERFNHMKTEWEFKRFGEKKGGLFSSGNGQVTQLSGVFVDLPFGIPLAGNELNWLGFYIFIAMPLTFLFRKLLGVQ